MTAPNGADRTIPYTHWAYFADKTAAEACGKELDLRFDCLSGVDDTREWAADDADAAACPGCCAPPGP